MRDVSQGHHADRRSDESAALPQLVPPIIPVKVEMEDGQEATRLLLQRNTHIPADIPITFDTEEFNNMPVPSLKVRLQSIAIIPCTLLSSLLSSSLS